MPRALVTVLFLSGAVVSIFPEGARPQAVHPGVQQSRRAPLGRSTVYRFDQGIGALLVWTDLTGWDRVSETVDMLHTGQGAATLGLMAGVADAPAQILAPAGLTPAILTTERHHVEDVY